MRNTATEIICVSKHSKGSIHYGHGGTKKSICTKVASLYLPNLFTDRTESNLIYVLDESSDNWTPFVWSNLDNTKKKRQIRS